MQTIEALLRRSFAADSADITFVAVRGAARKLGAWLSPLNPPGLMRRIFPSYT